jgi:biopolymer transport protein ExbD
VPVKFRCSECTQKLSIDDKFVGKLVACVRCGAKQRVPLETSAEFAQPKPAPPAPAPPETSERKAPRTFKPWQPRPVRSTPLPSETPAQESPREEPFRDEPVRPRFTEFETAPSDRVADVESPVLEENPSPQSLDRPQDPPEELWPAKRSDSSGKDSDVPEPAPEFDSVREPESLAGDSDSPDLGSLDPDSHDPQPVATVADPAPWAFSTVEQITGPQSTPISVAPQEPELEHAYAAPHAEPSLVPPAKKLDVEELIDMTAMVDIVFFLLIFFLVTSMHTLDSTIPMPAPDPQKGAAKEPTTIAAIDADDSYIVVRIDKNDKITIEGAEVRSERDLLFKLRDLRLGASRPEKLMVIGHGEATHGTAVMILDAGRELGMEHVKLSVQDEEE